MAQTTLGNSVLKTHLLKTPRRVCYLKEAKRTGRATGYICATASQTASTTPSAIKKYFSSQACYADRIWFYARVAHRDIQRYAAGFLQHDSKHGMAWFGNKSMYHSCYSFLERRVRLFS